MLIKRLLEKRRLRVQERGMTKRPQEIQVPAVGQCTFNSRPGLQDARCLTRAGQAISTCHHGIRDEVIVANEGPKVCRCVTKCLAREAARCRDSYEAKNSLVGRPKITQEAAGWNGRRSAWHTTKPQHDSPITLPASPMATLCAYVLNEAATDKIFFAVAGLPTVRSVGPSLPAATRMRKSSCAAINWSHSMASVVYLRCGQRHQAAQHVYGKRHRTAAVAQHACSTKGRAKEF